MSQAFTGSGYIQQIALAEVNEFVQRYRDSTVPQVELALRARFNPSLTVSWFGSVMELINAVTMLSIILTGAALIREREHGTIEHLLVMPVSPAEIMLAKVWSMGFVVPLATAVSVTSIVQGRYMYRSRARYCYFSCALGCTCSPRRRWGYFWRPWRAPCLNLAC
jgi:ABC-2 type transport system permease protein